MSATLVVAATLSNGIGASARLPWRLPKEMAYFLQATSSAPPDQRNAVIMGRTTWESIPEAFRPLKERFNVIITRNLDLSLDQYPITSVCHDLNSALLMNPPDQSRIYKRFIIGGAQVYSQSLNIAIVDRILMTRILSPAFEECNVFMPEFRSPQQIVVDGSGDHQLPVEIATTVKGVGWHRCTHSELEAWVGFSIAEGIQEERNVRYVFQMWERNKEGHVYN